MYLIVGNDCIGGAGLGNVRSEKRRAMTDFKAELCDWEGVRDGCRHNPDFGKLLQAFERESRPPNVQTRSKVSKAPEPRQVVRVKAKYGASIAKDGRFNWGALEGAKADDAPAIDWNEYRYADIPICIVTKGAFEVSTNRRMLVGKLPDDLTVPHFVAQKGDFLGLFETLSPLHPPAWNVTSGVHSVFFSPPLRDQKKIKAFFKTLRPVDPRVGYLARQYNNLEKNPGLLLSDHSLIVKELLRPCTIDEWHSELLIFGSKFLRSLGFDLDNFPALVRPTRVADLLKTFTIAQLAAALQVHLSVSHDSDGRTFTAERSAARLVAMANGATPVFAPVTQTEADLLPASILSDKFRATPIHNPDQHHFILFAPQSLLRSRYGYFSLHIPYAEFDWERPITDGCLLEVVNKLQTHKEAIQDTEVRYISPSGLLDHPDAKVIAMRDTCFMKKGAEAYLVPSKKLLENTQITEAPLSNPYFAYMVELQKRGEAL
jgi:hypothetical protein